MLPAGFALAWENKSGTTKSSYIYIIQNVLVFIIIA